MKPVVVCSYLHFLCDYCSQKIVIQKKQPKCPYCRKQFKSKKFQLLEKCDSVIKSARLRSNVAALNAEFFMVMSELQDFSSEREQILDFVNLAKDAMKKGNFDVAISILTNLIRQNFNYAESESYIGLCILEKRYGILQQNECEWYWKKYGPNLSIYDQLGLCFMLGLTVKQQKMLYKKLLREKDRNSFKLLYGIAALQHSTGNYKKALMIYKKITQKCSSFSKPYEMLATIYSQLNNRNNAIVFAKKCLKINPQSIYVKLLLVFNSKQFGFELNRKNFIQMIQQGPANYQYYNFMSFLLPFISTYRSFNKINLDQRCQADLRKKFYHFLQHLQVQQISVICDRFVSQAKFNYQKICLCQQIYHSENLKKYEFEWKYYLFAKIHHRDFKDISDIDAVNSFICQSIKSSKHSDVFMKIIDKIEGQIVFKEISQTAAFTKDIMKRYATNIVKKCCISCYYFVVVRVFTIYY